MGEIVAHEGRLKDLTTVKGTLSERLIIDLRSLPADSGRQELIVGLGTTTFVAEVCQLTRLLLLVLPLLMAEHVFIVS